MVESLQTMTHSRPGDAADAGDDAGAMDGVVVHAVGGERRSSRNGAPGIDQRHHPLARQKFAARQMALAGARRAAFGRLGAALSSSATARAWRPDWRGIPSMRYRRLLRWRPRIPLASGISLWRVRGATQRLVQGACTRA